jgi:bile acid:Na+ symporter, BASS family
MNILRLILGLAALCFVAAIGISVFSGIESSGPFFIAAFIALAIGFKGYESLKGYTYTAILFASAVTAMFYPQYFVQWGDFKLSVMIVPLIQLIMFGMGTSMSLQDFMGVVKTPKGVLLGVVSHFIIMPLLGFSLANVGMAAFGFSPEIAAGIILIGCSPNGLASNVISYLAKANLALSITITAVSTLLAPIVTPLLMKLLAGEFVEISVVAMMWDIFKMVILPIGAGLIVNKILKNHAGLFDKIMPSISMFGIAGIIVIITAAGRDSLLTVGLALMFLVLVHNIFGYTLGYWSARLFKMEERDCRTIAIEVGMQNGGLASGLAKGMGKMATVGLAPVIFSSFMNITGSLLATYWKRKPLEAAPPKEA